MQDQALKELSKFRGFGFSWQKFYKNKNKKHQNQKTHTKTSKYGFYFGEKKKKNPTKKTNG